MSSNHDSQPFLEASVPAEDGEFDDSQSVPVNDDATGGASSEEVFVNVEPVDGVTAGMVDIVNQEPSSLQVDRIDQSNGVSLTRGASVENDPSDLRATEDGGKEDMFVDCPDELIVSDNREAMAVSETQQWSEEKDNMLETHVYESDNGTQVHDSVGELAHPRTMLGKPIGEKEGSAQGYEEERDAFMKELTNLHHQLKALNGQQPVLNENDGGLVDGFAEMGEVGAKIPSSDNILHDMMNDCSKFVENALNVRLQTEGKLRELQQMLFMKDREIEDLHAKVTELSISRDVAASFSSSAQNWSDSLKVLPEVQDEQQNIEAIANRLLVSLAMVVNEEEVLDSSITEKMSQVEKNTSMLIEKYNSFLYEIDLLGQCLTEVRSDVSVQDEFGTTFVATRNVLLELKRKEVDLAQNISNLEDENKKLLEQFDKDKETAERANADVEKLRVELEQEKTKYANTKEKLSLAVTKGKALVQQRDSLKQSLAQKTSELEKCLSELQEKSSALEDAEISKEALLRTENLASSLQETLSQRDTILAKCEEILSETTAPQELQSADIMERILWLVDELNTLNGVRMEFHKLIAVLSSIDLPEHISSANLESCASWLVESISRAKSETNKLQDEIARISKAGDYEIERLTTSLVVETVEKNYLKEKLEDLNRMYEEVVEKERQVSLDKDRIVHMLLEATRMMVDSQEEADNPSSDVAMLIERCFVKVREQSNASFESSGLEAETFERIQTLLYIKDLELMLHVQLLEEDTLVRSKVDILLDELRVVSQELQALKDKESALQKDLERSEEKSALLREKLSMAVKKGKGLVQERENLKKLLDEKTAEIEKLNLELQQQVSALCDCKDQICKLSSDVEVIPKLETDLTTMKDRKDQLEQFLAESNNMLQRVVESIDGIVLPIDSTFEEPVDKVKWLSEYLNECQVAKMHGERELEKLKVEASTLSSKLAEAYTGKKTLEEALSIVENNISLLAEEKKELEFGKTYMEQELQRALEDASSQAGKFTEVCTARKLLEDALVDAENKISILMKENEDSQLRGASVEMELKKVKEDVSIQTTKLAEAYGTIKSLEDALSEAEDKISITMKEKEDAQLGGASVEMELEKVKEEVSIQTTKLAEAYGTVKSLEDALAEAENKISILMKEKEDAQHSGAAVEIDHEKVEEEIASQTAKLAEAYGTIKSFEDASVEAENKISILTNEKENAQLSKAAAETELEKVKEEVSVQTMKLVEAYGTIKSLEYASSEAENKISILIKEKEDAQLSRAVAEMELEKLEEEISIQATKLVEAYGTIKSLEDTLSQLETNVSLLSEENNNAQIVRTNLDYEMKRLKEEADSHAGKLADACSTIKSLEDALLKAENKMSELAAGKKNAEEEISALNFKLNACTEELAGTNGSLESRSLELSGHLNNLQLILKDQTLLSLLRRSFEMKFESLKDMDHLLKDINYHFVEMGSGSEMPLSYPATEEYCHAMKFLTGLDNIANVEMDNGEGNAEGDCFESYFKKTVEGIHHRNKILANKFEGFSTFMDEFIAALSMKLRATRDELAIKLEEMRSLKHKVNSLEMCRQEQENKIAVLENDISILLSACTDATQELEIEENINLGEMSSVLALEKLTNLFSEVRDVDGDAAVDQQRLDGSKYVMIAENLLLAARKFRALAKQLENARIVSASAIKDLENKLTETRITLENSIEERDINQNRLSKLESDLEALQRSYQEMRFKLEDYQAKEGKLNDREAEISSLHNTLLMKEKESQDALLSASQLKSIYDKIDGIETPFSDFTMEDTEFHGSDHAKKLFYIIDAVASMQHHIKLLSHEKEELQSTLLKQVGQIEQLKEEVEEKNRDKKNFEQTKSEVLEMELGLENIIKKLGGNELVGDQKSAGVRELLPVLEKLVMAVILENENSKSKAKELGVKLLGSQKVVDELSTKVKLLEDSNQSISVSPEHTQDRSIFEAPSLPMRSEITEIEDVGPLGKKTVTPPPSAAHVRTLRKASNDHLAINVDTESDHLMKNEETDEDKGRLFKSLNTSGLVPIQGKMIADRIDGMWVSGDRALMSRPRARLGLIAYWLFLHIWLLGTIL